MNWIDKLERKFGRFGVENLTMYVIICYVVGYFLTYLNPNLMDMMSLDVAKILHGQVWRLVTWVILPPSTGKFPAVCDLYPVFLLSDWNFSGTYLGCFSIYPVYFFRTVLCADRRFSDLFYNRWLCYDRWSELHDWRRSVYDILRQSFCISCLCDVMPGYADPFVVW